MAVRRQVRTFRPDVVLSFMGVMNMVAGAPVVTSERIDPGRHDIGRFKSL
jgi:hypothetical protein